MPERPILLTGFEPYGGHDRNPAQAVAEALHGTRIAGSPVHGHTLAVRYDSIAEAITTLIHRHDPCLVLCLGLSPGEPMLRLERLAVNVLDCETADNAGTVVQGRPIDPSGPGTLSSTLPWPAIRQRLLARGLPARPSNHAGLFLCNAVLYLALQACATRRSPPPCGFVHLPWLPEQVAARLRTAPPGPEPLPSMALATQIEAVSLILETVLQDTDATSAGESR